MKSCRRFPSFLESNRSFASLTTSLKSATSSRPSSDSLVEGFPSALEARKLLRATSICSFYRRLCVSLFAAGLIVLSSSSRTYRWHLAILEGIDDAVNLKLAVDIRLLLLGIQRLVDTGHSGDVWYSSGYVSSKMRGIKVNNKT